MQDSKISLVSFVLPLSAASSSSLKRAMVSMSKRSCWQASLISLDCVISICICSPLFRATTGPYVLVVKDFGDICKGKSKGDKKYLKIY